LFPSGKRKGDFRGNRTGREELTTLRTITKMGLSKRGRRNGKNPIIITKQAARQQKLIGNWLPIENLFMEKILTRS
jgi:hypothetical protein